MTEHTPAPWTITEALGEGGELCFHEIRGPDGLHVSSTWAGPNLPNARLIAAAPELLEALRQMLTDPPATLDEPDPDHEVIKKMREIARAAIAKATNHD